MRKSTGKEKSLRGWQAKIIESQQKSRARKQSLLGSQFVYIDVFSNDFATVDVREELCYHSRPKKQNSEGMLLVYAKHSPQRKIDFLFIKVIKPVIKAAQTIDITILDLNI